MKGGIYTQEKCAICGTNLKYNQRKRVFACPNHPKVTGTGRCFVRFGKPVQKRFSNINAAEHFLNHLRYKTAEGSFDAKDYQANKPNSFTNLSEKYLKRKRNLKSYTSIKHYIKVAQDYFGHKSVKDINGADIEDWAFSIENISEKTRANYASTLSNFWRWLHQRNVINLAQMPAFPKIQYELKYRTITDIETQEAIINEVWQISKHINEKIWLGIDILSTYVNLRPGDLLKIEEKDIDLKSGLITIHHPTKSKNKSKTVRLMRHHIEIIEDLKKLFPAVPDLKFFRHIGGSGIQKNGEFGKKYFKKWWDKACKNIGIEGLDLYGGTRHTTTTAIAKRAGTDNARKASGHETNKAFDRYCQFQDDTAFEMAKLIKGDSDSKIIQFRTGK